MVLSFILNSYLILYIFSKCINFFKHFHLFFRVLINGGDWLLVATITFLQQTSFPPPLFFTLNTFLSIYPLITPSPHLTYIPLYNLSPLNPETSFFNDTASESLGLNLPVLKLTEVFFNTMATIVDFKVYVLFFLNSRNIHIIHSTSL